YSFVADHFQYIASIGIIVLIVSPAMQLLQQRGRAAMRVVLPLILLALTWHRQSAFVGLTPLWADTVEKNPTSWMARVNYAKALMADHRLNEAAVQLADAADLNRDSAEVASVRGSLYAQRGDVDRAIAEFQRAVRLEPRYADPRVSLGELLRRRGD